MNQPHKSQALQSGFPHVRLRRLRQNETFRRMMGTPAPPPEKFLWPVFVCEGTGVISPLADMPGQSYLSVDRLGKALEPLVTIGIGGVMLFGVVDGKKSRNASYAHKDNGLVQRAIREIKKHFPAMTVFTDVCLCEHTPHGHCGILDRKDIVLNDPTNVVLGKIAVSHAAAGADGVAPSSMMDGKVLAIRTSLDIAGFQDTVLMSYSTKFASSMYEPFRKTAHSAPKSGDRRAYQVPYDDSKQAIRESAFDEAEGADILMVKPALFYLDIISRIKQETRLPLAAFNVSGEYSMLIASADRGWGSLHGMVRESLAAIQRAGADIIISYWANQYLEIFANKD